MAPEIKSNVKPVGLVLRHGSRMIFRLEGEALRLPTEIPQGLTTSKHLFSTSVSDKLYGGHNIIKGNIPEGYVEESLRTAYNWLTEDEYTCASKLMELLYWEEGCRYCGYCGHPMQRATEISMKCAVCGREVFAPVSPAVIVLVTRGEEALLVHARNFTRPYFGLVAGFVETGECLEECVAREVMEETNLRIKNVRYAGSQSWPYPNSLMIGFTAEYDSGELRFADGELTEGGFFSRDNLPMLPPVPSIARMLIEKWLQGVK